MFVNTFTADQKYSPLNRDDFTQPIWIILSQKRKSISQFVPAVLKSRLNFEIFKKRLTLIANVFPKLPTRKDSFR